GGELRWLGISHLRPNTRRLRFDRGSDDPFLDPVASGNFGIWNQSSGRTLVARQATYRRRRRARPAAIDGRTRCRCQAAGVSRAPRALRARRCDSRRRGDSAWCAAAVAAKHLLDPAEPASPLERLATARERGG